MWRKQARRASRFLFLFLFLLHPCMHHVLESVDVRFPARPTRDRGRGQTLHSRLRRGKVSLATATASHQALRLLIIVNTSPNRNIKNMSTENLQGKEGVGWCADQRYLGDEPCLDDDCV